MPAEANRTKQRSYLSGAMVLAASNILCRILGFVYKVPLANLIGAEGMGYYGLAMQVFSLVSALTVSGIPVVMSRMVASAPAPRRRPILRTAMLLLAGMGAAGTAVLLLFAGPLAAAAGSPLSKLAIMALAPTVLFSAVESAYRGYFQGRANMMPNAAAQLADAAVKLVSGTAFAWYFYQNGYPSPVVAAGAVLGVTVGTIAAVAVLYIAGLRDKRNTPLPEPTRADRRLIRKSMLRLALPLTIGSAVVSLIHTADAMVILNRLRDSGLTESAATQHYGAYTGLAVTVYMLPSAITSAICASVLPVIASASAAEDKEAGGARIRRNLRHAVRVMMTVVLPAAAAFALMPYEILSLVFSRAEDVAIAVPLLRTLAPAAVLTAFCALSASALHALGKMTVPVIASAAGGIVKLVLNYLLIGNPAFGILGVPLGTIGSFVVSSAILLGTLYRQTGFGIPVWHAVAKPGACAAAAVCLAKTIQRILSGRLDSRFATLTALAAAAVLYVFFLLCTRVWRVSDLRFLHLGRTKPKISQNMSEM